MDITKEQLTYSDTGDAVYTVQIKDFHNKMKNWTPTKVIRTKSFQVLDVDLYLCIYPTGYTVADKGNVSAFLYNDDKRPLFVNYKLQIGDSVERECTTLGLMPTTGVGFPSLCNHVSVFSKHKPDDQLKVVCKIMKLTTDKLVWDTYFETKAKLDGTNAELVEAKRKLVKMDANLEEAKTKLARMAASVEELQNTNNNNPKAKKPPCPVCFEEMSHDTKIAQCLNGHHLCWECKEKLHKNNCPSCGLPVDGRAFGMESYLRSLFAM